MHETAKGTGNKKDLVADRLATTDAKGYRVYLYPADVRGKYRSWRTRFQGVLLLIFLVMPWIRVGGHQAVLLDIPQRRFSFFGITFWAHDAPMLFFVIGGFAITLAFATSVWGRIWCGWACPQTVFIDAVFRRIERWLEGDSVARKRRNEGPMTGEKFFRRIAKWSLFILATLVITHSFLAYFVGTEELARMVRSSPAENPTSFLVMLVASIIVLFDFGWFREQFCVIACPYGRFQSVLMDDRSMIVGYDAARGEPRGIAPRAAAEDPAEKRGDCVNCYRCVQVCPTGIDIRRGVQMECIACTSCADACDLVMSKLGKPQGLIRYTSLLQLSGKKAPLLSIRARIYLTILVLFASGLVWNVIHRRAMDISWIRVRGAPFETVLAPDGGQLIVNRFQVELSNQSFDPTEVRFDILSGGPAELVTQMNPLSVIPGREKRVDIFARFPKSSVTAGHGILKVQVTSSRVRPDGEKFTETKEEELRLVGPFQ